MGCTLRVTPTSPAFVPPSRTAFPSALARAVVSRATAPTMTRMQSPDLRACPHDEAPLSHGTQAKHWSPCVPHLIDRASSPWANPVPRVRHGTSLNVGRTLLCSAAPKSACPDPKLGRVSMRLSYCRCARSVDPERARKECWLAVPRDESSTHQAPTLPSSLLRVQPTSSAHLPDTQTPCRPAPAVVVSKRKWGRRPN